MNPMPSYWKTRLKDVEETCALVKKGKVTRPCFSAGGRPIYCIEYGSSGLKPGTANLSSALGGKSYEAYADKTGADYRPTLFLCGCVHGGEFEGTAAVLNLIKLLETGTDFAGQPNEELTALLPGLHLILVPMANPDGRSHIPFDSFVGKTFQDLRYYNQGTWKDGSLCGWPGCKLVHPIKEHVSYLGGYFNDDGVNMMHEDFFSGNVSTGTRLVLDICRQEAPDLSVLLHGGSNSRNHLLGPTYSTLKAKQTVSDLSEKLQQRHQQEEIPFHHVPVRDLESGEMPPSFNLVSAMHHCCGGAALTYESNQGLVEAEGPGYTYDQIYRAHQLLFAEGARMLLSL